MEFARLLKEIQPKVFVMENVTGMVKGYMKQAYLEIIKTLRECGYKAKGEVMNAMYFNVPQSRERVIIVGVRDDLWIEPSHPKPQGKPITFRQATKGCKDDGEPLGKFLCDFSKMQPKGLWSSHPAKWKKAKGNLASSLSTKWADWDSCCGTLIKQWVAITGVVHPDRQRYISQNEAQRLTSFPDNFQFIGKFEDVISRMGNSVPPNLMKAIAEHIKINILDKIDAAK